MCTIATDRRASPCPPGLTAASQVPRMFAAAGLAYEDLLARMVAAALT
ncbi:hypothetical protein [Herbiconiux sp.]|nr:hypothetical protein [Herbiconiux sp.]